MRAPEELNTLFRANGLKITPQRHAVFEALHGNDQHPTADVVWAEVCDRMPSVSLRTVYQALNDLVELGEVQAVSVDNGAVRFDPNVTDHHHFVCRNCDGIHDVMAVAPELTAPELAAPDGHSVDAAEVIFRGTCSSCL